MIAALRSQWIKLSRPTMLAGTLVASVAFALLATVIGITSATDAAGSSRSGPGPDAVTKATLAHADGIVHGIGSATQFLGIVALVVCALSVASEYSYGTLRNLLVRQPRRGTLLAGNSLALVAFLALAAVVATLASALVALPVAAAGGIDSSAWLTAAGADHVAQAALDTSLTMIGFGAFGVLLGLLTRSPAAAIGIGVAYFVPVESILGSALGDFDKWLPGKLLSALADGGSGSISYAQALLVSGLYAGLATVVAARLFRMRDVTA